MVKAYRSGDAAVGKVVCYSKLPRGGKRPHLVGEGPGEAPGLVRGQRGARDRSLHCGF